MKRRYEKCVDKREEEQATSASAAGGGVVALRAGGEKEVFSLASEACKGDLTLDDEQENLVRDAALWHCRRAMSAAAF